MFEDERCVRETTTEEKLVNEVQKLKEENTSMKKKLEEQELQLKGLYDTIMEQEDNIYKYRDQNERLARVIRAIQEISEII